MTAAATVSNLPATKPSLIQRFAERAGVDADKLVKTLKDTVFKMPNGAEVSNEQLLVLLSVAEKYNLDPMVKEIYAFPAKGGGVVPIVSVDGWIAMMINHPQYDGHEYTDGPEDKGGLPSFIECRVHRKDHSHPTTVREYMAECKRGTEPWNQWPRRMLRHKATIQAARAAFGFAGVYDPDEADRIIDAENGRVIDVQSSPAIADINAQVTGKPVAQKASPTASAPIDVTPSNTGDRPPLALDGDGAVGPSYGEVRAKLDKAPNADELDLAESLIDSLADNFQPELRALAKTRRAELTK